MCHFPKPASNPADANNFSGLREEELVEASSGGQGTAQGRDERAVWMAHAETSVASPVRSALWSDNQFHILEMQTGAAPSHRPARCSYSLHLASLTLPWHGCEVMARRGMTLS